MTTTTSTKFFTLPNTYANAKANWEQLKQALESIKPRIRAEHKHFSMVLWYWLSGSKEFDFLKRTNEAVPQCGYAACIFGHMVLASETSEGLDSISYAADSIYDEVAELFKWIGLDKTDVATLVIVENWFGGYCEDYISSAPYSPERAEIACQYIDYWVSQYDRYFTELN